MGITNLMYHIMWHHTCMAIKCQTIRTHKMYKGYMDQFSYDNRPTCNGVQCIFHFIFFVKPSVDQFSRKFGGGILLKYTIR